MNQGSYRLVAPLATKSSHATSKAHGGVLSN